MSCGCFLLFVATQRVKGKLLCYQSAHCTQAERGRRETPEEGASCDLKAARVTLQIEFWLWLLACRSQPWTGLTTSLPCCCLSSQSSCRPAPLCLCCCDPCCKQPKQRLIRCVVLGRNVLFFSTEKALNFMFELSRVFLGLSVCAVLCSAGK